MPTHRRGVIPVGPARTVQGDPFGLVRRTVLWTEVTELFVHPRTVALDSLGAGLLRDLEGSVTEDQSMSDLAFHALRDYQPGDDRRYIHWRSSAKAGRLLVRQFLDTRRSHVCVVVDPDAGSYRGGAEAVGELTAGRTVPIAGGALPEVRDLETALSVAGSIALRCFRDDQDTTVVCGPHATSKATPHRTLDTLSPGGGHGIRHVGHGRHRCRLAPTRPCVSSRPGRSATSATSSGRPRISVPK
ncbi:MAG: DUF58 domain-containing protein [Actinomycetales bacterium]|nr:DUF58 domain-containing protein [Actinomycetales bacterium]